MDFFRVITEAFNRLDQAGASHALIGGFAMAMRSVQRAPVELAGCWNFRYGGTSARFGALVWLD